MVYFDLMWMVYLRNRKTAEMTNENLNNAENAKNELSNVLEVSYQLDKYLS